MLKQVIDAILRVFFGHTTVDNVQDWKRSHDTASASRRDIEETIEQSQNNKTSS